MFMSIFNNIRGAALQKKSGTLVADETALFS